MIKKHGIKIILLVLVLIIGMLIGLLISSGNKGNSSGLNISEEVYKDTGKMGMLIGIVDDQQIMEEAKVYVSLRKSYEAKMLEIKSEADKQKKVLKDENDRIALLRAKLSHEEFNKEVEKFARKQKEISESINNDIKMLENKYMQAITKLRNTEIENILKDIATEEGLSVISSKSVTLYYQPSLDLTQEVLSRLNDKISTMELGK